MNLLIISNLSVNVNGVSILQDINLSVQPAEIITIVGPNGSGKSTLLRTIIGAVNYSGKITRKPNLKIGFVPQKLPIDPNLPLTVTRFLNVPQRRKAEDIKSALSLSGLDNIADRPMAALSGGQFQRVLLARAILDKPDLLLLDEATQGLDQPGAAEFYMRIEAVRRELGCAIMMVSHDLHVVMAASDRVICLNGHICCEGAPDHVASAPEYRALFGTGTKGALALYRHQHDHTHDQDCNHNHQSNKAPHA